MQSQRYLTRSWALLTNSQGWIKPVLALTAATFVPIVGGMGVNGYALEWARLTAWGVDAAPKQKNVDIPSCIVSGFRALLVGLGIGLIVGIPTGILRGLVSALAAILDNAFGVFLSLVVGLVLAVVTLLASCVVLVAQLRCAIYEKIGAGFSISNIYQMIRRDINGFLRIIGIHLILRFVIFLAVLAFVIVLAVILTPFFMSIMHDTSEEAMRALAAVCIPIAAVSVPFSFLFSFLGVIVSLVSLNAVGLWVRQFNVPAWGAPDDPLPEDEPLSEGYPQG